MITFDEARQIVKDALGPEWTWGTLHVPRKGYEDADGYLMTVGAREWLVDGDPHFQRWDAPLTFVDKHTGAITYGDMLTDNRVPHMTPVGGR